MKPLNVVFVFLLLASACTHSNSVTQQSIVTPSQVSSAVQSGAWRVSLFQDSGNNETYKFNNYLFTFNPDGTLTASNGSNTVTGSWSSGNDDSKTKLILSFANVDPWDELSDDWHVISQNNTLIQLQDVSGGNGGTDLLNFTKN